jgi:hypothetical protein
MSLAAARALFSFPLSLTSTLPGRARAAKDRQNTARRQFNQIIGRIFRSTTNKMTDN